MNERSWALYNMRKKGQTENTKSELRLLQEIYDNCIEIDSDKEFIKTQFVVKNLKVVEDIKPTYPPPKLDIAIPDLKIAIRVNGLIHSSKKSYLKDMDQKLVLEGNGWSIIDINYDDREDLWN